VSESAIIMVNNYKMLLSRKIEIIKDQCH
jgi:hypothetical protein